MHRVRELGLSLILLLIPLSPGYAEEILRFDATLRVDLHHAGDQKTERFMLDELRVEGPWPSSRTGLVDPFEFGSNQAELYEAGPKGKLLFRQGYCTLFQEWQTSDEAKVRQRTFSETVRFPMPTQKVKLVLTSRNRRGQRTKMFEMILDPASEEVSRERRRGGLKVVRLNGSGDPQTSLDIVILGDGYQDWQMEKYRQDSKRFAEVLLSTEPFSRFRPQINVWAVESPSRESGVDEPRKGIFRDTALSVSFNTFGMSRYLMTTDNKAVRDVAANAPYDVIYLMSNTSRYGGGGIYNLYASFVSDNEYDDYVFVHEFGHSFAGLGDEYFTSQVAFNEMYPRGVEPWEPNITAQKARAKIKWRELIKEETPVPTTEKDAKGSGTVGLFEGAGYSARGLYRPARDCKMFDKGHKPFCPVCMKAVSDMIERYLH
jgi:hypothetical protein